MLPLNIRLASQRRSAVFGRFLHICRRCVQVTLGDVSLKIRQVRICELATLVRALVPPFAVMFGLYMGLKGEALQGVNWSIQYGGNSLPI